MFPLTQNPSFVFAYLIRGARTRQRPATTIGGGPMSKRKQSTYQFFSVVLVVGLALLGTMVCAQDKVTAPQTETGSARDVRTSSGLGEPTPAKSVVGKAYSNSVGQP